MYFIITIIVVALYLFLSIIVIKNNKSSFTNIIFFIFCLAISLWAIINYASLNAINKIWILFWMRSVMALAVIQSSSFFLFVHTFPNRKIILKKKYLYSLLFLDVLTIIICYSPFLFKDVILKDSERSPVVMPGMLLFLIVAIGLLLIGFIFLIKKYKQSFGLIKNQLKFILFGSLSMFLFIILFNFIFVIIFKISIFINYTPFFILPFIFFTTHSIVRYRLMDIKLIISRSIIFFLLTITITAIFVLVFSLSGLFFADTLGTNPYLIWLITAIIIVIGLGPLKKMLALATDKVFYKGEIDYDEELSNLSKKFSEELSVKQIVEESQLHLMKSLKIKSTLLLVSVSEGYYLPIGADSEPTSVKIQKVKRYNFPKLTNYLREINSLLILDELERKISDTTDEEEKIKLSKAFEEVKNLNSAVIMPIVRNNEITALLVLGVKNSGDVFSNKDIKMLEMLAPQLSSALFKASLYQEAQLFNIKLRKEVEKATRDLKTANGQLEEINAHLKDLDKAKSEFMSITSHQLRTPLTGIMGYLSMIIDGDYGKMDKEQYDVLKDVLIASQRLIRMVNVFLNITRIEAGRFNFYWQEADLYELIKEQAHELVLNAEAKGLKLVILDAPKDLPHVMIDHDKIKDVIINLIDNSIKYTEKGNIEVGIFKKGDENVEVIVKDTGIGIDPKEAVKLFDKFTRGDGMARINPNGAGLGLFIARKMVEGHHGKIWVESEGAGKGSEFHVVLPIKQIAIKSK